MRTQKVTTFDEQTADERERIKVLAVRDDHVLLRLAMVWPAVRKTGASWEDAEFSYDEWCALAGVPTCNNTIAKCERLISLNLISPEGELSHWLTEMFSKQGVS
jgi:hypothetical protein